MGLLRLRGLPRVIAASVVTLVVVIVATVAGAIYWLHEQAFHSARTSMTQLTAVIAEQTERAFESIDTVLQTVIGRTQIRYSDDADISDLHVYFARHAESLPQARVFHVLDSEGQLLVDSERVDSTTSNESDRRAFAALRHAPANQMHITPPVKDPSSGEWRFAISRRLETWDGEFNGIVSGTVESSYFLKFFRSLRLPPTSSISLVTTEGNYLLRYPTFEPVIGRSLAGGQVLRNLPTRDAGVIRGGLFSGENRLLSFHALEEYPLVLLMGESVDTILGPWRIQAIILAVFGIVAIILVLGAGGMLIRLSQRQTQALREARRARFQAQLAKREAEQASKAAEHASRSKSEFLAGVSHDLRTPLNSIIGFSEVMLSGVGGGLSDKSKEYVGFVLSAGQHLLSLINNLLDLAKIEANRLTIRDDKFLLHSVVGECMRLVASQAGAAQVALVPYVERDLGLRADPLRIRQILFNLLSNAIKFTPAGGQVEVRSERAPDGDLRLSVVDTGCGMTEAEIATARQPYGQVVNAYTRHGEGTGLGLPLVEALIALHGGRFELTSTPGAGTVATAVLPASRVLDRDSAVDAA